MSLSNQITWNPDKFESEMGFKHGCYLSKINLKNLALKKHEGNQIGA